MKKKMSYANARNVPFVAIIGETERQENKVSLKNMVTGEQMDVPSNGLVKYFLN
jgi:histidyl-tRNA synthetase